MPIPSVRWALAGLSVSMLLSSLGTSIANVALPTLAQAFNASFQDVQWIVLAYLLAITTLIVSVGPMAPLILANERDRIARRLRSCLLPILANPIIVVRSGRRADQHDGSSGQAEHYRRPTQNVEGRGPRRQSQARRR